MPFKEHSPMEERIALLRDYEAGVFTVSDLCRRYGISRETFYVWRSRRLEGGKAWFVDRTHAPKTVWLRTPEPVVAQDCTSPSCSPNSFLRSDELSQPSSSSGLAKRTRVVQ